MRTSPEGKTNVHKYSRHFVHSPFTYLEGTVDTQGGTDADVRARICKALAAFLNLKKVWSSREPS